jgi:hypothetical protein
MLQASWMNFYGGSLELSDSEDIREFHYEPKYGKCIFCDKKIRDHFIYYDMFGSTYCQECYFDYKDDLFKEDA